MVRNSLAVRESGKKCTPFSVWIAQECGPAVRIKLKGTAISHLQPFLRKIKPAQESGSQVLDTIEATLSGV